LIDNILKAMLEACAVGFSLLAVIGGGSVIGLDEKCTGTFAEHVSRPKTQLVARRIYDDTPGFLEAA
jgi:hypothetical protein